ncbi:AAA family ATPase [uncultured Sphingomonas sp.]|uniref:AAA family ATPase n=1 Tax=uncultured Sphingomonas sp. TaxID=158754 RepID=UPI0025CFDC71|nr:ATP-binding protein [uncultured Sphingomonas sp.]
MRLKKVTIENYKALGHLEFEVRDELLFLIGANGAGKSSILQALSLVRYFATGATTHFFRDRGWKVGDVRPKTTSVRPLQAASSVSGGRKLPARNFAISLVLEHEQTELLWTFRWSYSSERTLEEGVWILSPGDKLPRKVVGYPSSAKDGDNLLTDLLRVEGLQLPGSIFALIRPDTLGRSDDDNALLADLKSWAEQITSLEMLNPTTMRSRLIGDTSDIGVQGNRLASFLANLSPSAKDRVVRRVRDFYPLRDLDTTRKRAGWIDMQVAERFKLLARIDVEHMSDGFLRILALSAIPEFGEESDVILLDEVEDGIEPHILPRLIERISAESDAQLIMTSHSPLLINFFDQEDVFIVGRDGSGHCVGASATTLRPFREAEGYLGIGEIWANADMDWVYSSLPKFRAPRRSISEQPTAQEVLKYLRG